MRWLPAVLTTALALAAMPAVPERAAAQTAAPVAPAAVQDVIAESFAEYMTDVRMVLGSVSNEASARDAAPRLTELRQRLDALLARVQAMSPTERAPLVELINRDLPTIRSLAERILNLAGVGGILREDLQAIVVRLQAVTT